MADWNPRANELFLQALDLPPADRPAFLARACGGDVALRRAVDDLLAAAADAGSFLNAPHPVVDATRAADSPVDTRAHDPDRTGTLAEPPTAQPAPEPGLLAGRYRLGGPLGEGGMGTVYRAEQVHPVRRPVAVKLIKAGGDTARVIARFEAERQALTVMDHPHIAKVLDAGTTPTGQPFFIMELVNGVPLTRYADDHRLSIPQRLELSTRLCAAVQHAHQKGIIHRDLKPSNILVAEVDGKPVPKVIDFGLAKALQAGAIPDVSLEATGYGSVLGTPLYMAPEQADPGTADIDTRADVYALGVLLYELLTGSTPHTRDTLRKAALGEMLRIVREVDPPTPVRRLASSEALPGIAAVRQIEPAKLARMVRGDLEWVTMKALAKDREQRYESAANFAADVERFLAHEPVSAGPPSRWYRVKKFVRRHRGPVTAAAVVAAAVLLGFAGTATGLVQADEKRREAERARADEADQRGLAEANAADARRASAVAFSERYSSDVRLVQRFVEGGQFDAARGLLDRQRPERTGGTDLRGFEWHYWRRYTGYPQATVRAVGRWELVRAAASSADGTVTAVYTETQEPYSEQIDGRLKVFELTSGRLLVSVPAPTGEKEGLIALAVSPDGSRVATAQLGGKVSVQEADTGKPIWTVTVETGAFDRLQFSPDSALLLANAGGSKTVVLDAASGKVLHHIPGLFLAEFAADNRLIGRRAAPPDPKQLKREIQVVVCDPETAAVVSTWTTDPGASAFAPAMSGDGKRVAYVCGQYGSPGGRVVLAPAAGGPPAWTADLPPDCTPRVARFHPTGRSLLVVGDQAACLFDAASGRLLTVLRGWESGVSLPFDHVAFIDGGRRVASVGMDGNIAVWDRPEERECRYLSGGAGGGVFSGDDRRVYSHGPGGTRVWDADTGAELPALSEVKEIFPADSAGGRRQVSLDQGTVTVWELPAGKKLGSWSALGPKDRPGDWRPYVGSVCLSPDGSRVTTCGTDGVKVWVVDTGKVEHQFRTTTSAVGPDWAAQAAFSPDGKRLAAVGRGGLRVWELATENLVGKADFEAENGPTRVAYSPDGKRLVTGGANEVLVQVWEADATPVATLIGHTQSVTAVAFTPDGSRVISAAGGFGYNSQKPVDNTVRVWEVGSWAELLALHGSPKHGEGVTSLAVSPDGRRLLTACADGSQRLWDTHWETVSVPPPKPAK